MKLYIYLLFLPLLLFSNINNSIDNNQNLNIKTELDATVALISLMSKNIHSLQQERGASTGFVSSKGKKFQQKLEKIKIKTDKTKGNLLVFFNLNYSLLKKYFNINDRDNFNRLFNETALLRENV